MKVTGKPVDIDAVNTVALFISDPDNRVTLAEVTVTVDGVTYAGTGVTKRMTGDSSDPGYGRLVALSRAMENLSATLMAEVHRKS